MPLLAWKPGARVVMALSESPQANMVSILSDVDLLSNSFKSVRLSRGTFVPLRNRFATLLFLINAPNIRPILSAFARQLFITKSVIPQLGRLRILAIN